MGERNAPLLSLRGGVMGTTTNFLKSVLGDDGYYCLFAAHNGKIIQKFYTSIDEVLTNAKRLDERGVDTYFGLGTYNTDANRKADNVKQLRAFFLDIDCGPNKDYPDQKTGIEALKKFIKGVGLPTPTLVNSGRGIHVYWPLKEPATYDEWFPVAERLKAVCVANGFSPDPAVTSDAARVLRVPETHNHKDPDPKPTYVLGEPRKPVCIVAFNELLEKASGGSLPVIRNPIEGHSALMDRLAGNFTAKFKTILKRTIEGTGCEQIRIIARDQNDIDEPLWRAGLSICNACTDGEEGAKRISSRHSHYDEGETLTKMRRIQGPYLCETFDLYNPGVCPDCPHWKKIKTPLLLGKTIAEATSNVVPIRPLFDQEDDDEEAPVEEPKVYAPEGELLTFENTVVTIPTYPKPFFRGKNGGVYMRELDEDGNRIDTMVYKHDLYVTDRIFDEQAGESIVFRLHLPHDGMREFTVPMTALSSYADAQRELSFHGVVITPQNRNVLMGYVMNWVNELQETTYSRNARRQFGWTEGHKSFVLGGDELTADEILKNPPSTTTLQYFPMFKPKGTLEGWKKAMEFYNEPGMELHQFVICSGFGSILMEMLPNVQAAGMHLYSADSGFGKTTALLSAASIWGNYKELVIQAEDTINFAMHRGQVYHNLPLYVDEITNKAPEALSDFVLQLTHGKSRGRMKGSVDEERARGVPWSLLSVSTGNVSLVERVSLGKRVVKAEAMRIMEINVDKIQFTSKETTDDFNQLLANNYGHAGPIFVRNVLADLNNVESLLLAVQRKIDRMCGLDQTHRFWSAFIACTITAAMLAKRWGLITFNTDRMLNFTKRLAALNRQAAIEDTSHSDVEELIADYLLDHYGQILQITSTKDLRGIDDDGASDALAIPTRDPYQKLVARYETDTHELRLVIKPFREWCLKQSINYTELSRTLRDKHNVRSVKSRLTKGTRLKMPTVNCLIFKSDFIAGKLGIADDDSTDT